jgi:acyl-CoA thioesterase FadM
VAGYGWLVKTEQVSYELVSLKTGKLCNDGWLEYVLVDLTTGRSRTLTEEMIEKYSV